MRHLFTLAIILFFTISVNAAAGDTTWVTAISNANLNSPPSNDDIWAQLPNGSVNYSRILMKFTLGCGTPDCSNWDYTVKASIGKKTGVMDSTITAIDTLTGDTSWNVFDVIQFYEIGRLITPYGTYMAAGSNGFNSNWTHPFYYDVTDFASLLQDSTLMRITYDGWSDAFSGKIELLYIEGEPSRTVSSIQPIFNGYGNYPSSADFENVVGPQTLSIPAGTTSAKVWVIITGHGSQGEFDPHDLHLKVNSTEIAARLAWKDNCGLNAVFPQGGTWIFNRANWCPGEGVPVMEFDVSNYITAGQNVSIDLDMDDYVVAAGEGAGYIISSYLITYSSQKQHDVMLEEIIAPNNDKPYLRFNPICSKPMVKIKNMGKSNLTYAEISYWVKGGAKCYYEWNGFLPPHQSTEITLPPFDWGGLDTSDKVFYAEARWPNQVPDEYEPNNMLASSFSLPPVLDSTFRITLKTNDHPEENAGGIKDENGNWVFQHLNLAPSTTYTETISLSPGCYVYELTDYDANWEGGDGLSWWLNTQQGYETAGALQFRKSNNQIIRIFNPDFGNRVHYQFMVGYPLSFGPPKPACEAPIHSAVVEAKTVNSFMDVVPNPGNGKFLVRYGLKNESSYNEIQVFDIFGGRIYQNNLFVEREGNVEVNLSKQAAGVYVVVIRNETETLTQKVLITR